MAEQYLEQWNPRHPTLEKLAQFLREARQTGDDFARVPKGVPLIGGQGLGELLLDTWPEALSRVAYDEPLTTGRNQTLQLHKDVAGPALGVIAGAPGTVKGGKATAKALVRELENAASKGPKAAQRGALGIPERPHPRAGQRELPGMETEARERHQQLTSDRTRAAEEAERRINERQRVYEQDNAARRQEYREEGAYRLSEENERTARERATREAQNAEDESLAELDDRVRLANVDRRVEIAREQNDRLARLMRERDPRDTIEQMIPFEREIYDLKREAPIPTDVGFLEYNPASGRYDVLGDEFNFFYPGSGRTPEGYTERMAQRIAQRRRLGDLEDAAEALREPTPPTPAWADELTMMPTDRPGASRPADADWWQAELERAPVEKFFEAIRDQDEAFQYGAMPKAQTYGLEDMLDQFAKREGIRAYAEPIGSDSEPQWIKVDKEHGQGEAMRDQWGDYIEEPKLHDAGDFPMYDDTGTVKKVDTGEVDAEGNPILTKRVAEGGEPYRDEYGDTFYRYVKSEGGEPVRDERGRVKQEEVENPNYDPNEVIEMTAPQGGKITVDYSDGMPTVDAQENAGPYGSLLYQALLANASREGEKLGGNSLTYANQLRLLSNTLANYARTGDNPRNVRNTLSGSEPRATGFAEGYDLWRALSGETRERVGKQGIDPLDLEFTGSGFTHRGEALTPDDIADRIGELSPNLSDTKVGQKTLMQDAVFRWLRNADPLAAEEAGKGWTERIGRPLFGAGAGTAAVPSLYDLLNEDAPR